MINSKLFNSLFFLIISLNTVFAQETVFRIPSELQKVNITTKSYLLKDESNNLTFETVQRKNTLKKVETRHINEGTVFNIYWIKLTFQSTVPQQIYLEFTQPHTNKVKFYILSNQKSSIDSTGTFGDYFPFYQRPFAHRNIVLPVDFQANETKTLWIKIDKRNESFNGRFILWEEQHFEQTETKYMGFYGLVFGWQLIYLLWVIIFWIVLRQRMLGFYTLFMAFVILYNLNNSGLGFQFFWYNWHGIYPSLLFQISILGINLSLLLFNQSFFNTKINFPKIHRVINILLTLGLILNVPNYLIIINFSEYPIEYQRFVFFCFSLFFLLVVVGFLVCAVLAFSNFYKKRTVESIIVAIPYAIYTIMIGSLVLVMLGLEIKLGESLGHKELTAIILMEITFFTIAVFLKIYNLNLERKRLAKAVLMNEVKVVKAEFEAKTSERQRISRDLHDNIGANLTKIITDLDLLSLQLEMNQSQKSTQQVENTRNFTQSTIRALRDTVWAMNKDTYDASEFSDKAETFLQNYLEDNMTWKVVRNLQTERQLTSMQVLNLLRIIQEATQNMLKYSKATDFKVIISNKEKFNLKIIDNGIGFNKNTVSTDDNYGLYNMQKRAEDIGGSLNIETKENEGVVIDLYL